MNVRHRDSPGSRTVADGSLFAGEGAPRGVYRVPLTDHRVSGLGESGWLVGRDTRAHGPHRRRDTERMDARPTSATVIGADVVEVTVGVTRMLLNRAEIASLRVDLDDAATVLGLPSGKV